MQFWTKLFNRKQTLNNFNFLLLGAGRGGTSLLHSCLSAHSQLEIGFEHGMVELLGYSIAHADLTKIYEERTRRFRDACLAEAEKCRPKLWGNKITTEQLLALEDHYVLNPPYADVVERFFTETLPGLPVVFIVRDGRACIASKVRRTGQSEQLATLRWRSSVRVLRYLRERHENNHVLRFEDLLQEPEQELRRVCDFLKVDFEPRLLANTRDARMPEAYRQQGFDRSKAAPPQLGPEIEAYIREDLKYCGYE